MESINLPLIMGAAFLAAASPGPATLAIATTSMQSGRRQGLALASGITTGSITWAMAAALGLGALMFAHVWLVETIRVMGAFYLLYLAYKSAKSAFLATGVTATITAPTTIGKAYLKGLAIHLTNPKAILFFGSLFAIGVPVGAPWQTLAIVIGAVCLQGTIIFHFYAILFSSAPMTRFYMKMKRGFDTVFALAFGAAALRILTTRMAG